MPTQRYDGAAITLHIQNYYVMGYKIEWISNQFVVIVKDHHDAAQKLNVVCLFVLFFSVIA